MNARFYLSNIGRFASPDTIIPHPTNPQSFNRFSYTRNNPLRFLDPSGHDECSPDETECRRSSQPQPTLDELIGIYGIGFTQDAGESWSVEYKWRVLYAVMLVDIRFRQLDGYQNYGQGQAWQEIMGTISFHRSAKTKYTWYDDDAKKHTSEIKYGAQYISNGKIEFYDPAFTQDPNKFVNNVIHEIGHAFNAATVNKTSMNPYTDTGGALGKSLPGRENVRDGLVDSSQMNKNSNVNGNYSALKICQLLNLPV